MVDERVREALERFILDLEGAATLGGVHSPGSPHSQAPEENARRRRLALEELMRRREALVQGDRLQSLLPLLGVVVFAALGVGLALWKGSLSSASVAVGAALAAMFRLLQVNERAQHRRFVLVAIQLAAREEGFPVAELARLLLVSSDPRTEQSLEANRGGGSPS